MLASVSARGPGLRRLQLVLPHRIRFASLSSAPAGGANARRRAFVLIGSVGFGMLASAPLFYYLARVVGTPLPPYAAALRGKWEAEDDEGRRATLRVNAYGMAALDDVDGKSIRGAATFESGGGSGRGSITIAPLGPFGGPPRRLDVERWPVPPSTDDGADGSSASPAAANILVAGGLVFAKSR